MDREENQQETEQEIDPEELLEDLKQRKSRAKAVFTRIRHQILRFIEEEEYQPTRREIYQACEKLDIAQEKAINIMTELSVEYFRAGEKWKRKQVGEEIEQLETEYHRCHSQIQEYLESMRKDDASSIVSNVGSKKKEYDQKQSELLLEHQRLKDADKELQRQFESELLNTSEQQNFAISSKIPKKDKAASYQIGDDMWKHLKRVGIPVFSGDKRTYENWKAAFTACIDQSPMTPEYKLLQLRQYLSGPALQIIESLGHTAAAYEVAKDRLDRKYGGKRRQVALCLEELQHFRPIRDGQASDLERFADLLDIAVINLKEAGRQDELGNGSLYTKLQRKMTQSLLTHYHRWIYENHRVESVVTLREWVIQEAEFQTIANEVVHGLSGKHTETKKYHDKSRTYFGNDRSSSSRQNVCKVCSNQHGGVWRCNRFKNMSITQRWESAKHFGYCYCCLGDDHRAQTCRRQRVCGIDGCQKTHHQLLHGIIRPSQDIQSTRTVDQQQHITSPPVEGQQAQTSMAARSSNCHTVALRTVPVILKHGNKRITVNALLDDGSTKTYINADVAAELGLQGQPQKMTVNVLNGQIKTFETMPVEFGLESLTGEVNMRISAFTTNKVTGDMRVINWRKESTKWAHLNRVKFPVVGPRPIVDILIGLDYADLHYSVEEVRGNPGEPMARLTPLGWTCIGKPHGTIANLQQTNFVYTYFVRKPDSLEEINRTIRQFWEIEDIPKPETKMLSTEDQVAYDKASQSLTFADGRYQVAIPWKEERTDLPNNYSMALKRLENTEKRLMKKPLVAKDYSNIIDQYTQEGYIRKVTNTETEPANKWYLPHFPVIQSDRQTTKTRIVFDASARYQGISLNDAIYQGPKLQQDLFDVLLRFRKNPVALVCDIAQMYLRIEIPPQDRPYHRFIWRNLDETQIPQEYEFTRIVFGVNASPFLAQFVSQQHARKFQ